MINEILKVSIILVLISLNILIYILSLKLIYNFLENIYTSKTSEEKKDKNEKIETQMEVIENGRFK